MNGGFESDLAGWEVEVEAAEVVVVGRESGDQFQIYETIGPVDPLRGSASLRTGIPKDVNESLLFRGANRACQTFASESPALATSLRIMSVDPRGDDSFTLDLFRVDGHPNSITMRDSDTGEPVEFDFPQGPPCRCSAPPCTCEVDAGKQGDFYDSGVVKVLFEGLPEDGTPVRVCYEVFNRQNSSKSTWGYWDDLDRPPVAVAPSINPALPFESDFVYFDCASSFDPDGDSPLRCQFTITSTTGEVTILEDEHPAPTLFTFPQDGIATVELDVTDPPDPDALSASISIDVPVANAIPLSSAVDVEIEQNGRAKLTCRALDPGYLDPFSVNELSVGSANVTPLITGEEHEPELGTIAVTGEFSAELALGSHDVTCRIADDDAESVATARLEVLEVGDIPLRHEPANDLCGDDTPALAANKRYRFALEPGDTDCFVLAQLDGSPPALGDEFKVTLEADNADLDLILLGETESPSADLLSGPLSTSPFHPSPFHPSPFHPSPFHPSQLYPSPFHPSPFHPSPFHPSPFHPSPLEVSPYTLPGIEFASCPLSQCCADLETDINSKDFSPQEILVAGDVVAQTEGFTIKAFSAASGLETDQALVRVTQGELRTFVVVTADDAQPPTFYDLQIEASTRLSFKELNQTACTGAPLVAGPETTAVEYFCGEPQPGSSLIVTSKQRIIAEQEITIDRWNQFEAVMCDFAAEEGFNVASLPTNIYACDVDVCSSECWNGVAESVRSIVHDECASGCDEVVVVGDDFIVPFLRKPDLASIGNEIGFTDNGLGPGPIAAAAHDGFYLTDQHLCDFDESIAFAGGTLHLPDVPCSRVVETIDEMQFAFQAYLDSGGDSTVASVHVDAYEFLSDGGSAIEQAFTEMSFDVDALIGNSWTREDALCQALGTGPEAVCEVRDFISFQGHMNPWLWQTANGFASGDPRDVILAEEFGGADLRDAVAATIGCHSGLNNPDRFNLVCDGPIPCPTGFGGPDMAQEIVGAGGTARLMTGFGLGETDGIAGNEFLDVLLAFAMARGAPTFGQADVESRVEYVLSREHLDEFDIKVLEQAQIYGLAGRRVSASAQMAAAGAAQALMGLASSASAVDEGSATIEVDDAGTPTTIEIDPLKRVSLPAGDYLTFEGDNIASGARFRARGPILELPLEDSTDPAHDCLLVGGEIEDIAPFDHFNRGADYEWNRSDLTPEPANQNNGFAPAVPCWVNTLRGQPVQQRAYFAVAQANAETQTERVWRLAELEITRSSCAEFIDPQVSNLTATADAGGDVIVRFDAVDASGIAEAIALTNVGGTFVSSRFDLSAAVGPTYELVVPNGADREIKAQIVDACGNALLVTAKSQTLRAFEVRAQPGNYALDLPTTLSCIVAGDDFASLEEPIGRFDFGDGTVGGGPLTDPAFDVTTDPMTGDVTVSIEHVYGAGTPDPVQFQCTFTDRNGVNSSGAALLDLCGDSLESADNPDGDLAACSIERSGVDLDATAFVAGSITNQFQYRMSVPGCGVMRWDRGKVTGPASITPVGNNGLRYQLDLRECGGDGLAPTTVEWSTQAGERGKKRIGFRDVMPDEGGFAVP